MTTIKIKGMSCSHCTGAVQGALEKLDGVKDVIVDLDKGEARYEGTVDSKTACHAIEGVGFEAAPTP